MNRATRTLDVVLIGATALLRRWRLVAGVALAVAALAAGLSVLRGTWYVAQSSYVPHLKIYVGSRTPIRIARFGTGDRLRLPETEAAEGPGFYAWLVRSPGILRQLATTPYVVPLEVGDTVRANLIDLYGIEGDSEEERVQRTVRVLARSVSGELDAASGLVTVRSVAPHPVLAEALNRRILALVEEFIQTKRRERAVRMREFAAERMREAEAGLAEAERALERFRERNQWYRESPELRLEARGLERRLENRKQTYLAHVSAYEDARIDEADDTELITIVDRPKSSVEPIGRGPLGSGLVGLGLGLCLGLAAALGIEWLARRLRRQPAKAAELRARIRGIRSELTPSVARMRWKGSKPTPRGDGRGRVGAPQPAPGSRACRPEASRDERGPADREADPAGGGADRSDGGDERVQTAREVQVAP